MTLKLNETVLLEVATARRRGLKTGARLILALSDEGAPREPEPRHGVHMTETGFTRLEVGPDGEDIAAIGYGAFWAVFQHEDLTYNHPHGGHAKFLSLAVVEGEQPALEAVAAGIRELLT